MRWLSKRLENFLAEFSFRVLTELMVTCSTNDLLEIMLKRKDTTTLWWSLRAGVG